MDKSEIKVWIVGVCNLQFIIQCVNAILDTENDGPKIQSNLAYTSVFVALKMKIISRIVKAVVLPYVYIYTKLNIFYIHFILVIVKL